MTLLDVIAYLFAVWTLQDSINCYQKLNKSGDKSDEKSKNYLLKPHAAQIISILRILGFGYEKVVEPQGDLHPIKTY